jgi:hypothetical protein
LPASITRRASARHHRVPRALEDRVLDLLEALDTLVETCRLKHVGELDLDVLRAVVAT